MIRKQPGANTITLSAELESVLAKLQKTLPEGMKVHPALFRQADFIQVAVDNVAERVGAESKEVFETAIENIKPRIEVRSKRVGGATYQVPMEVRPKRQQSLAIRWLIDAARAKRGKPMGRRLADELFDAFNNQGAAVTKKENVHKMADANKAYAHFAWGRR